MDPATIGVAITAKPNTAFNAIKRGFQADEIESMGKDLGR